MYHFSIPCILTNITEQIVIEVFVGSCSNKRTANSNVLRHCTYFEIAHTLPVRLDNMVAHIQCL